MTPEQTQHSSPKTHTSNDLAIVGLVCAFLLPLVGLIVSIVALTRADKYENKRIGFVIGGIATSIILPLLSFGIIMLFSGRFDSAWLDTERQTDIKAIDRELSNYHSAKNQYPTRENMNDRKWRVINFPNLVDSAYMEPEGWSTFESTPAPGVYAYQVFPAGCNNVEVICDSYTLTATLHNGKTFTRTSTSK